MSFAVHIPSLAVHMAALLGLPPVDACLALACAAERRGDEVEAEWWLELGSRWEAGPAASQVSSQPGA